MYNIFNNIMKLHYGRNINTINDTYTDVNEDNSNPSPKLIDLRCTKCKTCRGCIFHNPRHNNHKQCTCSEGTGNKDNHYDKDNQYNKNNLKPKLANLRCTKCKICHGCIFHNSGNNHKRCSCSEITYVYREVDIGSEDKISTLNDIDNSVPKKAIQPCTKCETCRGCIIHNSKKKKV